MLRERDVKWDLLGFACYLYRLRSIFASQCRFVTGANLKSFSEMEEPLPSPETPGQFFQRPVSASQTLSSRRLSVLHSPLMSQLLNRPIRVAFILRCCS
jgi:hypothetical protein